MAKVLSELELMKRIQNSVSSAIIELQRVSPNVKKALSILADGISGSKALLRRGIGSSSVDINNTMTYIERDLTFEKPEVEKALSQLRRIYETLEELISSGRFV